MTGSSPPPHVPNPHPSKSSLSLEITQKEPATSPPTVLVTVTNLHESTSLTLLTWDTPFDDKALLLGIFRITDLAANFEIPSPGLKINRALPPPRDALLELEPRHAITKEIVLDGPGAQLEKGTTYEVKAKGSCKAVWHASAADIGEDNLIKMGGGTGVIGWDFESNVLRLQA